MKINLNYFQKKIKSRYRGRSIKLKKKNYYYKTPVQRDKVSPTRQVVKRAGHKILGGRVNSPPKACTVALAITIANVNPAHSFLYIHPLSAPDISSEQMISP
jgi:hypothetical protein